MTCAVSIARISNYHCSDTYYLAFPKDRPTTKILVYAVYAAELTQAILFAMIAYKQFGAGFGNVEAPNEIGSSWFVGSIINFSGVSFWLLSFACLQVN